MVSQNLRKRKFDQERNTQLSGSLVNGCGTATFLHKSNKELSLRDVILIA